MTPHPNLIAGAVLKQFSKLPAKRKPNVRGKGVHEWVPLSGIVAEKDGTLTCLALATGMKCLPASKLAESNGVGIHDWHAEVLAVRTFNRFLLDECASLLRNEKDSAILRRTSTNKSTNGLSVRPFEIRDDVKLHMYCSEAPCGDASMELTMAAQADASPWQTPEPALSTSQEVSEPSLPGRAYFSQLGVVRRKPARGDAPPTLSKSCSDKIALKQCTSLLSSLASVFVHPANAYIHSLVLPESQYSLTACKRAFSAEGRMHSLVGKHWPGGYSFSPFTVEATDLEFEYSRRLVQDRAENISASNLAATWSYSGVEETIIGGVIQGRKPFSSRGASQVSRRCMWQASRDLAMLLEDPDVSSGLLLETYRDVKNGPLLVERREVKSDVRDMALSGWIRNTDGANFGLDEHNNC